MSLTTIKVDKWTRYEHTLMGTCSDGHSIMVRIYGVRGNYYIGVVVNLKAIRMSQYYYYYPELSQLLEYVTSLPEIDCPDWYDSHDDYRTDIDEERAELYNQNALRSLAECRRNPQYNF